MVINLPETLGIVQVASVRDQIVRQLDAGQALELDARAVTEVDVAGLQLLEATFRSATNHGLALRFVAGGRGGIDAAARIAGLRLADDASLWREDSHG